jgi:streptogramin lyase
VTAISPAGVPLAGSPYTAGSIVNPQAVAIDSVGSVWVTNFSSNTVTKLASTGLTGVNTTAGSQVQKPGGLAIDASNTAWMTNLGGSGYPALIDFASPTSYTTFADVSGGLDMLGGVAIDFTGHEWVTSQGGYVLEATAGTAGAPIGAGSLFAPTGVAIDSGGNAWVADAAQAVVTKIGPGGGTITQFSGGGLDGSIGIALDGAQNVWLANNSGVQGNYADGLSAFNSAGTALSTATGYSGGGLNFPYDVAVDGSGNVWATNPDGPLNNNIVGSVTELIGAGIPVVTPIAASLASPYTTAASKP